MTTRGVRLGEPLVCGSQLHIYVKFLIYTEYGQVIIFLQYYYLFSQTIYYTYNATASVLRYI